MRQVVVRFNKMNLSEISSLGSEAPKTGLAGHDLDDMPEMVRLSAEIDKLNSISAASGVNWNLVEQCSRIILRDYVKHFLVAAYYGVSLVRLENSVSAVSAGAAVFEGIFSSFWKDALPPAKRKKGRYNAVQFWIDNVANFIQNYSGDPVPQSEMDLCRQSLKKLDLTMGEIDENDAPSLNPLISSLRNIQTFDDAPASQTEPAADAPAGPTVSETRMPEAQAKAQPVTPAVAPASVQKPAPEAQTPVAVEIPAAENAEQKCRIAFNFLIEAADELQKEDTFASEAFVYRRIGAWMKIRNLPSNDQGLTRLAAPPEEITAAIEKLYIGSQHESLIRACESRVTKYLFWLDLSYYSAYAAEKLGHGDVASAIAAMVALFLKRHPGVVELKFENGLAMCGSDARTWIASFAENGDRGSTNTDSVKVRINDALSTARNDLDAAVQLLEGYIRASFGLEKLRYEAALALIFARIGRTDLSVGMARRIAGRVRDNDLGTWSADAAAEILGSCFDVYKQAEMLSEAGEVLVELAELSPVMALGKKYTDD